MLMLRKTKKIHLIGIGGIGMSGIAKILLKLGYRVTGSDICRTLLTESLEKKGVKISYQHLEENVIGTDVIVYSSAIPLTNCEIIKAQKDKIPIICRAEILAELMRLRYGIAIAGAHGKTTTTSMISMILKESNFDPTVIIGGRLNYLGNAKLGKGEYLVVEADESDGSFLCLLPTVAVVMNIDREHLFFYHDIANIKKTFISFINKIPFYGVALLCLDDKNIQAIIPEIKKKFITFGINTAADIVAQDIKCNTNTVSFKILLKGKDVLEEIELSIGGIHNVYNALAAIGVGMELDIKYEKIKKALKKFKGIKRRFEVKKFKDLTIIDDYGHHPTEIIATLNTAKKYKKRIVCIFQPHRYTRVKELLEDFATCFFQADILVVTEIYSAGEQPIEGISGQILAEEINKRGHQNVVFLSGENQIIEYINKILKPEDILLTLGAGDVYKIGEKFVERKKQLEK